MASFAGVSASNDPDFYTRTLPGRVLEKLTAPGMEGGILDLLVLDEAQDLFVGAYLDIFDLLLKGGLRNGRWLFFGDFERQVLFTSGEISVESFTARQIDNRCARFALNINCRNTQEISATLSILSRIIPGYSKVLRPDTRHTPELLFYGDDAEQATEVSAAIGRFLADGFKLQDIVLLSPYKEKAMASKLAQSAVWKNRLKAYALGVTTVGFTTIHAFKGLEAPVVILTDIDRLDDSMHLDLFYTGMSRALHRLVVMCHTSIRDTLQNNLV
jgi:superfamily I DNA/RNA helicase